MLSQLRQTLLKQRGEDPLVNQDSVKAGKVVQREILLYNLAKRPERLLLIHAEKQLAAQKVHSLKVPDLRVALNKGIQNVGQSLLLLLLGLLVRQILVRADHVFLNLADVRGGIIYIHLLDCVVVAAVVVEH